MEARELNCCRSRPELHSAILPRIADAVETLGFVFIQNRPTLPLFAELHNRSRKPASLFEELDDAQKNMPQCVHGDFPPTAEPLLSRL